jgi:hypothetical protein
VLAWLIVKLSRELMLSKQIIIRVRLKEDPITYTDEVLPTFASRQRQTLKLETEICSRKRFTGQRVTQYRNMTVRARHLKLGLGHLQKIMELTLVVKR